ncbi:Sodium/solute symporter family and Sodium/solute symporter, subgroup family-containing protein [Aphelenchoides besseyi]|nr:Sodium/solute symporter family and Sodium/solute symporter, subgroup family-containing protein [Aphelenchoides besseyi]KAI6199757.1 Sodium/solute symporter family and Sodium/solute symporter, subgroup family-containing protein [Aphelenchoides besseyi]
MFQVFDYVIFGLFLALSLFIGVFHGLKARFTKFAHSSADEYLTGGHQMPVIPICLSLLTTFISGIALLGLPAEIYLRGASMGAAHLIGSLAFLFTGLFFIPMFYKLRSTNVYEYFELRFDSTFLRGIGTFMFLLNTSVYLAIVVYAPSIALSGAAEVQLWPFIIGVGFVGTIYTSLGGIKAVVWADTLQSFFLIVGLGCLLIKGTIDAGGLRNVLVSAEETGRLSDAIFRFDINPFQYNNFWISIIGGVIHNIGIFGLNQMALQRYCAMPSLKQANYVMALTVPAHLIVGFMAMYLGLLIFAYFHGCDPIALKEVSTPDQLTIILASKQLYLGCLDSFCRAYSAQLCRQFLQFKGMNSMCAVIYEDAIKPHLSNERHGPIIMKMVVIILGLITTGMAFLCQLLGGIFQVELKNCVNDQPSLQVVIATLGATSGPIAGVFFLGIFFPRANRNGALVGFLVSSIAMIVISILYNLDAPYEPYVLDMQSMNAPSPACLAVNQTQTSYLISEYYEFKIPENHYGVPSSRFLSRLSPFTYSLCGILMTVIIGLLVSWIWPQKMNAHKQQISYACTREVNDEKLRSTEFFSSADPLVVKMAAVKLGANALRELRIHLCQKSASSNGVRAFIEHDYVPLKKNNRDFPILIRECSGINPKIWASDLHANSSKQKLRLRFLNFAENSTPQVQINDHRNPVLGAYEFGVEKSMPLENTTREQVAQIVSDLATQKPPGV